MKGAQIKPKTEEFVSSMGQRSNGAASMDAQNTQDEEEYVGGTVHTLTITKNLQLSHSV